FHLHGYARQRRDIGDAARLCGDQGSAHHNRAGGSGPLNLSTAPHSGSLSVPRAWVGLRETEAARRLGTEGPNELPADRSHSLLGVIRSVLTEPMFMLLLGAVAVYLLLGDAGEAVVLACSLLAVIAITVYQERRTERALEALRDLSSPRALVIREGEQHRIPGREVVRGDLIVVREGD